MPCSHCLYTRACIVVTSHALIYNQWYSSFELLMTLSGSCLKCYYGCCY